MENSSLIRPRTLVTAIMALVAMIGALQAAPVARGHDGARAQGIGAPGPTAWVADDQDPAGDAALLADPAEPEDRQSDALAAPAGIPIPGPRFAGSQTAPAGTGPGSGPAGATRARGPPAHRA